MISSPEYRRKNWNILVPYNFDGPSDFALQEGIALSKVFGTGLILYHNNADEISKQRLAEVTAHIISNHEIRTQSFAPESDDFKLMFALANKTESIIIVLGHDCRRTSLGMSLSKSLRKMRKSRTPFLMVPAGLHSKSFKNVVYSMGYQKQEKEKILWASYFGRIYSSTIHVAIPKASDEYFKSGVWTNVQAMEKLYKNTEVQYKLEKMTANIHKADQAAIQYCNEIQAGAFITLTTPSLDVFDLFGGSQERIAICNRYNIPVLCINPRDDLYVLCN